MKIREVLDRLDEINRRDLLKGAGAAAVGGAVGYNTGINVSNDEVKSLQSEYKNFFFVMGQLLVFQDFLGSTEKEHLREIYGIEKRIAEKNNLISEFNKEINSSYDYALKKTQKLANDLKIPFSDMQTLLSYAHYENTTDERIIRFREEVKSEVKYLKEWLYDKTTISRYKIKNTERKEDFESYLSRMRSRIGDR